MPATAAALWRSSPRRGAPSESQRLSARASCVRPILLAVAIRAGSPADRGCRGVEEGIPAPPRRRNRREDHAVRPQGECQLPIGDRREDLVEPAVRGVREQVALVPRAPTGYDYRGHGQHLRRLGRERHRRGLRPYSMPANAIIATTANAIQRTSSNVLVAVFMVVDGCCPVPHRVEISV